MSMALRNTGKRKENQTTARCLGSTECQKSGEQKPPKKFKREDNLGDSCKVHRLSLLSRKSEWEEEGFSLWKDLLEKGFAYIQIEDFSPNKFEDIDQVISKDDINNGSHIGYQEGDGKQMYYHRQAGSSWPLPKLTDDSLENQLDDMYAKLFKASSEVVRHVGGKRGAYYLEKWSDGVQNDVQQNELKLLSLGPALLAEKNRTKKLSTLKSDNLTTLLQLFEDVEKKKQELRLMQSNASVSEVEPHKILFDYPATRHEFGPDYLRLARYTNSFLESHTDRGLFSLVFRFQKYGQLHNGLEVRTKEGTWKSIDEDICNQEGVCVLIPGHQMELLSSGLLKATTHRVTGGGDSVVFALQASENEQINGSSVATLNQEWESKHRSVNCCSLAVQSGTQTSTNLSDLPAPPDVASPEKLNIRVRIKMHDCDDITDFNFLVRSTTRMGRIFFEIERRGIPMSEMRFLCDGAPVYPNSTPRSMGLVDGDTIDCFPVLRGD